MNYKTKRLIALLLVCVFSVLQPASIFAGDADDVMNDDLVTERVIMSTSRVSAQNTDLSSDVPDSVSGRLQDAPSDTSDTTVPAEALILAGSESSGSRLSLGFPVPANAVATSEAPDSVTVSWIPVEGATEYEIYRLDTEKNDYVCIGTVDSGEDAPTEFTDTGLVADTEYTYRVAAKLKISKTAPDTEEYVDALVTTAAIAAPEDVSAVSEKPYAITVTWEPVDGAYEYRIYRYDQEIKAAEKNDLAGLGMYKIQDVNSENEKYICIDNVPADAETGTKYKDTGLSYGVQYYYKVTAVKALEETADETVYDAQPSDEENIQKSGVNDENVDPILNADENVQSQESNTDSSESSAEDSLNIDAQTVGESSASDAPDQTDAADSKDLLSGEAAADNTLEDITESDETETEAVVESSKSEKASAKVIGIAVPSEVTAAKTGPDSIMLSWEAVTDAKYYNVYILNHYINQYIYLASVAPFSQELIRFVHSGLTPGLRYDYKVVAVGEASGEYFESEKSETAFAEIDYAVIQPAQEVKQAAPAKPVDTTKSAEPTKPADATKPAEPANPAETTKAAEPAKPAEDSKTSEPVKTVEETKPAESEVQSGDSKPAEETRSAESEKPAEETKSAESGQADQETQTAETVQATQPAPAVQTTQVVVAGSLQGNAEMIWALGKTLGMTDAQCAGILGNMMVESGLDQTAVEGIFTEPFSIGVRKAPLFSGNSITGSMNYYTTVTLFGMYASRGLGINQYAYRFSNGMSCAGLGLIQFTGPLAEALLNFAKAMGKNWYDLDLQMAMVIGSSAGTKARCVQFMNDSANAGSVNGATASWLGIMEMGLGGPSYGYGYSTRCSYAQYWYNILSPNSAAITAKYAGFAASVIAMAGL